MHNKHEWRQAAVVVASCSALVLPVLRRPRRCAAWRVAVRPAVTMFALEVKASPR